MSSPTWLTDRLQAVPPALAEPPDRFEQVKARVLRRRQRRLAGAVAASAAVIAIASPLLTGTDDEVSGVDPATATPPSTSNNNTSVAPGGTLVTELAPAVEEQHAGTASVSLGRPPVGATGIAISLECLSAGSFAYPDGARLACNRADMRTSRPANQMPLQARHVIDLQDDQTAFTVTTSNGARWEVVASYVMTETTDWGVNENGQTYGIENEKGSPDLIRVAVKDAAFGYAYAEQLNNPSGLPEPTTPQEAGEYTRATQGRTYDIPVYESDGVTRIGTFTTG